MTKNSAHPVSVLIGLFFACLVSQACSGGDSAPRSQVVPTVGSITVMPSVSSIEVGQTQQYAAVVKDTNGNILSRVTVGWSSSQQGVATIDNNGLAQGLGPGTATITASTSGITSQMVILTVTSVPVSQLAPLPPWLIYCPAGACTGLPPVVVALCPGGTACTPARSTTVIPQVNGTPINAVFFPLVNAPPTSGLRLISGDGATIANLVSAYTASSVQVHSDIEVQISYYALPAVWGGTTLLNFVSTQLSSSLLDTVFYRHPSYDTGTAAADLHMQGQAIITAERGLTGIASSEHVTAYVMPTELAAATRLGEGNFSFGNGTITVNYGNPLFIAAVGGIQDFALARFAHEYTHELFNEISTFFLDNPICLNEGLADAVGFASGFLPEPDFGPIGLRGLDFTDGCIPMTAIHDIGNCYLWHLKQAGFLTPTVIHGLFHPQHTYTFDSCVMNEETGNSLLVYFTEAANGADLVPVLNATKLPHASSYAAAKQALGL